MIPIPFCVTADLQTPVILTANGYLTLDSMLGAAIFKRTGDVNAAVRDVPLAQSGGIWHGSAAFLDRVTALSEPGFKRGIQPREEMWAPAYQTGRSTDKKTGLRTPNGKRLVNRVDTVRDEYKSDLDVYRAIDATRVTWFGCGDPGAVEDLLTEIAFVGKKYCHGYGKIVRFTVEPVETDRSFVRLRRGKLSPMRPIPADLWQSMGLDLSPDLLTRFCAATLPYFSAPSVRCVVPASRDLSAS